jgi:hypothetical protein
VQDDEAVELGGKPLAGEVYVIDVRAVEHG